jgi:NAD(P)-dependent dehydrogenase (short-subunit alcohol dehydrogenase family)
MEVSDKVVVVTGGGHGIGAALARRFGAEGAAAVVVADLDTRAAGRVAAEVGGLAVETDVSSESDVSRLVEMTEDRFGPIDLFCANAGIAFAGSEQSPDDDWDRMWRVNFLSHVYAARHLLPTWQERGSGYFLATASAAGLLTNIGAAQYTVTKHAVVAFAEWLAITYGDTGIKVSCLCPQGVETRMLAESGPVADLLRATALTTEQVANVVVDGLARESFLILPHPEVGEYLANKVADPDRWLAGMRRLQQKIYEATKMEE